MSREHAFAAGALLSSPSKPDPVTHDADRMSYESAQPVKPGILDRPAAQAYLERVHQTARGLEGRFLTQWDRDFVHDLYSRACTREDVREICGVPWNPTAKQWNVLTGIGTKLGIK